MKKPFCDLCEKEIKEAKWPVYVLGGVKRLPYRPIPITVDQGPIDNLELDVCQSCITGILLCLIEVSRKKQNELEGKEE